MIDATPEPSSEIAGLLRDIRDRLDAGHAEGLSPEAAAAFLGISPRKLHDLNASGLIPEPAHLGIGKCPRWSRTELRAWLLAGSPSRARWNALRDVSIRRIA